MSFLKKITNRLTPHSFTLFWERLKRTFFTPPIPKNKDGKVLIHLGCGFKNDPRWINIDLIPLSNIHHLQDVTNLSNLSTNTADLIYASHVLEHVSHRQTIKVLSEWRRVLRPSGILRLSVPDLNKIIDIYQSTNKDINKIIQPLMGGQDYKYNFHYNIFNHQHLASLLKEVGFREVKTWNPQTAPYHTFNDWSSKPVSINGKKYPISLNIEAIK